MRRPITAITALTLTLATTGCILTSPPKYNPAPTTTDTPLEGRGRFGMPIEIPGESVMMSPYVIEVLSTASNSGFGGSIAPRALAVSPSGQHGALNRVATVDEIAISDRRVWHNVAFTDPATGSSSLLLNERGVISYLIVCGSRERDADGRVITSDTHALAFFLTTEDTNGDGLLTGLDARQLLVTDADGSRPRRVTPQDANVEEVRWDLDRRMLFLSLINDSTGDGRFDAGDEKQPYAYAIDEPGSARPLVSPEQIDRARELLQAAKPSNSRRPADL